MRLFVGVAVDDAVQREAERVMTTLEGRLRELGARWVPPENLHLTVRFIGHVPDDRKAALLAALDDPLDVEPFELELGGCGRFPPRGAPRVIWVAVRSGLSALSALHHEFSRRVAPFGYTPEERPFSAHLTLARLKDAPGRSGKLVDEALASIVSPPLVQHVDRVTIFESRLSRDAPRYVTLQELHLKPRNDRMTDG